MLNVEQVSSSLLSRRVFCIFIISFTAMLFVITGWTQFSCYPMVTGGVLPKFCTNKESILQIIKDSRTHGNTLMILAANPDTDENVLRNLTDSLNDPKVANNVKLLQRALAFNPKTPVDVLDAFVESEDLGILENIAKRSNATPELLRKVASNPHANTIEIQEALVNNPQVSEDVLLQLTNSQEPKILYDIAILKQTSSSVLKKIYDNPVASDVRIQRVIASNKNTSEDVLQKLAKSTDARVLGNLINHSPAYLSVLEGVGNNSIVWKDSMIGLQRTLAEKPNIGRKLIEKLASSDDRKILETLYYDNPTVPSDLKEEYRKKLNIMTPSDDKSAFQPQPPQTPKIAENPFPENKKSNCLGKHVRNNLIGGAAAGIGFLFGGPVGAGIVYGAVTGSMETLTGVSGCQF
jgi:hypothetical protein